MLPEEYFTCKKIIKKFIQKKYWMTYSSDDIFYILDKKGKGLITFVEQFFGDSYGLQLFYNRDGFNYVHDILTMQTDTAITLFDCDSICLILVDKKELKQNEIEFLHKNKIPIQNKNNLLFYRFSQGYDYRLCNNAEIKKMNFYIEILSSLLNNEETEIINAFNEKKCVLSFIDEDKREYSIMYNDLPYLEEKFNKLKSNKSFVEEFKDKSYINDVCYLFCEFAPVIIKENNTRPMILYFYYPKEDKSYFKYLIGDIKDYKEKIFTILYDSFNDVGMPEKMYINNRKIFSYIAKTLEELHIETEFLREKEAVDQNINDLLSNIYTNCPSEYVESEEIIEILMSSITKTLNDLYEMSDNDYNIEKTSEFIS